MASFWEISFWGNSVKDWSIALGITVFCFCGAVLLRRIVLKRLQRLASKTNSNLDDFVIGLLQRSVMPILYVFAVYFGLQYLKLPPQADRMFHIAVLAVTVFFSINIIISIISYSFQQFTPGKDKNSAQAKQAKGILLIIKIVLWVIGTVFLVDNLGYNITTIVTGLGIGGIAIALAAQTILGDLFSYLVIFFDKPFEAGDFIVIGDKSGVVEHIGIKTTRLKTLGGEQLIMSNTDLTNSRVQNFKRMEQRRVVLAIGVTYETSVEHIKQIPQIIREIIEAEQDVKFDRAHFSGFGDFSLNFEIVYYILTSDYVQYMNSQQAINHAILERFATENIDFAYPTQKLVLSHVK
jgi:small-conductance mechanosensitive channel